LYIGGLHLLGRVGTERSKQQRQEQYDLGHLFLLGEKSTSIGVPKFLRRIQQFGHVAVR
jgi:hypothetical protein